MSIYHCHVDCYRRSEGKTSSGGLAYRRGEKMKCGVTGKHFDFRKKEEVIYSEFINAKCDNRKHDLASIKKLYEEVEITEKHPRATVGREIECALPNELSKSQQIALVKSFISRIKTEAKADNAFFDYSIHAIKENNHVHIAMSERELEIKENNFVLSKNKNRAWHEKDFVSLVRKAWEIETNLALKNAGIGQRVDSRTLAAQAVNRIPTLHEGKSRHIKNGSRKMINNEIKKTNILIEDKKNIFVDDPELDAGHYAKEVAWEAEQAKKEAEGESEQNAIFAWEADYGEAEQAKKTALLKAPPAENTEDLTAIYNTNQTEVSKCVNNDDENKDNKEIYKYRLAEEKYKNFSISGLTYINLKNPNYVTMYFSDKSSIVDSGSLLSAAGGTAKENATRIVELARLKNWKSIKLSGSNDFLRESMQQALFVGLEVIAEGEEQEEILKKIKADTVPVVANPTDLTTGAGVIAKIEQHTKQQKVVGTIPSLANVFNTPKNPSTSKSKKMGL